MDEDELHQYTYLWDGTQPAWRLVALGRPGAFVILNEETSVGLIIEDDEVYKAVTAKMLASGVKVVAAPQPPARRKE
ncbi:MAG: hypothetical protein HOO96_27235 [Polyangiaceae bacterium]|nr:hypothetical protein [Polyangiaceae bacterium]